MEYSRLLRFCLARFSLWERQPALDGVYAALVDA